MGVPQNSGAKPHVQQTPIPPLMQDAEDHNTIRFLCKVNGIRKTTAQGEAQMTMRNPKVFRSTFDPPENSVNLAHQRDAQAYLAILIPTGRVENIGAGLRPDAQCHLRNDARISALTSSHG